MSSFVISREEYLKVAGYLSALNHIDGGGLFVGHYVNEDKWSLFTNSDFIKEFKTFFNANVLSFERQYNEPISKPNWLDENDVVSFEEGKLIAEYYQKAKDSIINRKGLKDGLMALVDFVECVNYQIEDKELNEYVMTRLNNYVTRLYDLAYESDTR